MAGFVFAILIFLAAIVIGIIMLCNDIKAGGAGVLVGGILLAILILVLSCVGSIPTGYTGILTTFGRVENVTLDAGICWTKPWQHIVTMDNRVQKQTVSLAAFSSDIQEVNMQYTINYQIDKASAMEIYRTIGVNYYDTIIAPSITEAVKTVSARYTAEELVEQRDALAIGIEGILSDTLKEYNINLVSTSVEDLDFTDAFTDAVEAKQVAQQNKLKAEIEQAQSIKQAQAEAEVAKTKAEADAAIAKIQAEADLEVTKIQADAAEYAGQKEAAKNKAVSEYLTDELLQYYLIQAWDGKYPTNYVGSDNVSTILNGVN